MTRLIVTIIVLGCVLAASWFMLPVWGVSVSGSDHLRPRDLVRLAGSVPGNPWLWVSAWRANGLVDEPWVERAVVTRRFPGRVQVSVVERTPAAVVSRRGADGAAGDVVVAWDGTPLPGAARPALRVSGWGPDRLEESLRIARLIGAGAVKEVRFSPQGFDILMSQSVIWTDSYTSLRRYGAGVRMLSGSRINVYPWGVSVSE